MSENPIIIDQETKVDSAFDKFRKVSSSAGFFLVLFGEFGRQYHWPLSNLALMIGSGLILGHLILLMVYYRGNNRLNWILIGFTFLWGIYLYLVRDYTPLGWVIYGGAAVFDFCLGWLFYRNKKAR